MVVVSAFTPLHLRIRLFDKRCSYAMAAFDGDWAMVTTRYLGSYEQEIHATDTLAGGGYGVSRTLHRHRLGGVVLTHEQVGQTEKTRMAVNLTDHIGSMEMVLRLATRHSPLATRYPPLATRYPPLATRLSPLATRL